MKKIGLILICFLITGCTANYNITIDENYINEEFTIKTNDTNLLGENGYDLLTSEKAPVYFKQNKYYDINYAESGNTLTSTFKYKHDINDYKNAHILDMCYPHRIITNEDDKIIISSGDMLYCAYKELGEDLTKADINVTTKLKVLENNADEISGNTYTWHINQDNYRNKPINMTISKLSTPESVGKEITTVISKSQNKELNIFLIIIFVIGILIYVKIKRKQKEKNEI